MLQNSVTKHPHQQQPADSIVETTTKKLHANHTSGERSSGVLDDDQISGLDATTILSEYHGATLDADLDNDETPAADTNSSDTTAEDYAFTPISQDELVKRICDAADMACKAKRINQLMSYVSGIDYSQAQNFAHELAGGDPGADNNKHLLATEWR